MKTSRLKPSACTACGHPCNAATDIFATAKPSAGDFSVCLACGHVMAFGADLRLRDLSPAERQEAAAHPQLRQMLAAHRRVRH